VAFILEIKSISVEVIVFIDLFLTNTCSCHEFSQERPFQLSREALGLGATPQWGLG
jgi:hypothetical protein